MTRRRNIRLLAAALVGAVVSAQAGEQEREAIRAVTQVVGESVHQAFGDEAPDWLKRTDISIDVQKNHKPSWSIETIQPLMQTPDSRRQTVYWQGRLAHGGGDETLNLGLGYRYLTVDEGWLLGINGFYDATAEANHRRRGLGLEAIGRYATFRINGYDATSGRKVVRSTAGVDEMEQALDGWDAEAEAPVPYAPWARVALKTYRWERTFGNDVRGEQLTLRAVLNDYLSLEAGAVDDNYSQTEGFIKFTFNVGRERGKESALFDGIAQGAAFVARDLKRHTLDKVQRHHDIVVEKSTTGGSGVIIGRRN